MGGSFGSKLFSIADVKTFSRFFSSLVCWIKAEILVPALGLPCEEVLIVDVSEVLMLLCLPYIV